MKAKKWLTIITGCISLLSLIAALIIGKTSNCILYDISMAIFGSALLGAIMSLTEYFVERRKAMEQFWDEARKVLKELRKIRYINVDAPHDLICACFSEEESNKWHEKLDHNQAESARNNLISWFEENTVMSFTEEDDIDAELERIYEGRIDYFRREYQRAIDSYVVAANIEIGQLSNAYGRLDFFFNKCIRSKAFNDIYQKIREFENCLLAETYHFNLLKEGHGKFSVCADRAYRICQLAFTEKDEVIGGFSEKVVYQSLFDEIEDSLECFRCEIYRNEKYEAIEKNPILGTVQVLSFEEKKK